MALDQKIVNALRLSDLKSKLPSNPRIVDIRVEDYVDTGIVDALRAQGFFEEMQRKYGLR